MKYVLVQTSYSPQKDMVIETYLRKDPMFKISTTLLSNAEVFDTFDEAKKFMKYESMTDYKIVGIDEKEFFTRLLKGT